MRRLVYWITWAIRTRFSRSTETLGEYARRKWGHS